MNPSPDDEYAEAFRRGYERARRGEGLADEPGDEPAGNPADQPAGKPTDEPTVVLDRAAVAAHEEPSPAGQPEPPAPAPAPEPVFAPAFAFEEEGARSSAPWEALKGSTSRAAIVLAVLALVLVGAAFGLGRLFADSARDGQSEVAGSSGAQDAPRYDGAVDAVRIADATASCRADSSVDAAGNTVTYQPANAHDSDLSTAWRCDGSGVGERFTITLPKDMAVAEVGLVPGYAKTDAASGVDRYAENNRITKVRWRFDDGTTHVQTMSGSHSDRSMRTMRVPETSTRRVVLEILASQRGPRNTVAISEIRIGTPAG